nr:C40 family peptidase [Bifidobacterium bombi]
MLPAVAFAATDAPSVTSSRSFHKMNVVRKDLLRESTASEVDAKANWGGVESLNVPQTQSQAEKDAAARKAAEDAAAAAAASRSESRDSLMTATTFTVTPPDGKTSADLVNFAQQFAGRVPYVHGGNTPAGWDCSGFVQYVFSQFGIALPRTSGAQANAGRRVPSLAEAMPGDIIANETHAAIYLGNGMIIHAANPRQGTLISPINSVDVLQGGRYSISRVL